MKKIYFTFGLISLLSLLIFYPFLEVSSSGPNIKISVTKEYYDLSGKTVTWDVVISTENIPSGSGIDINLSNKLMMSIATGTVNVDNKGYAKYSISFIPIPSEEYVIKATFNKPPLPSASASLKKIPGQPNAGQGPVAIPVETIPLESKMTGAGDKYKLLAPFAGFTEAPDNIGEYLNKIFMIAIALCGALAVLMIIISGVQYMGDESIFGKTNAKQGIQNSLFGLLIALSAYALLNTIDPRLLGSDGIKIRSVKSGIDEDRETEPWAEYSSVGSSEKCPEGFIDVKTDSNPSVINVCKTIAPKLEELLSKAKKDNIKLSGSGTRSYSQQKKLRIQNGCPDDNTPSGACNPPTARPGRSMHETGEAVDFNCNGQSMTESGGGSGKKSPCFVWLSKNAPPFLSNLKSEPWHWSTTGK